jgi:hypothetical protein
VTALTTTKAPSTACVKLTSHIRWVHLAEARSLTMPGSTHTLFSSPPSTLQLLPLQLQGKQQQVQSASVVQGTLQLSSWLYTTGV